jgi:hypothetical protein
MHPYTAGFVIPSQDRHKALSLRDDKQAGQGDNQAGVDIKYLEM